MKSILNVQYPYGGLLVSNEKTAETRKYPIPKSKLNKEVLIAETNRPGGEKAQIVGSVWFKDDEKIDSLEDFQSRYNEHKVPLNSQYDSPNKHLWHTYDNSTRLDQPYDAPKRGIVWGSQPEEGLMNFQGDNQDWTMTELEELKRVGRRMPGLMNPYVAGGELASLISPGGPTFDHTLDKDWRDIQAKSPARRERFLTWDFENNQPGTKMTKLSSNGEPQTLYHGAISEWTDKGVKKDKLQARDHGFWGSGFYVTSDPDYANGYADPEMLGDTLDYAGLVSKSSKRRTAPNVIPVYANLQNPFQFVGTDLSDIKKVNKVLEKYNAPKFNESRFYKDEKGGSHWMTGSEMNQHLENAVDHILTHRLGDKRLTQEQAMDYDMSSILQEAGFDGAIVGDESEVIIYEPEQVKSIWNQGTWNPLTDDLHTNTGGLLSATSTT